MPESMWQRLIKRRTLSRMRLITFTPTGYAQ